MAGNMLSMARGLVLAASSTVLLFTGTEDASAAACGPSWAEPGKYKIAGSFRGKKESTNAFLSKDCRITLQVPGVYTGGKVKRRGKCVEFLFKVEGEKKAFKARWCDDYGLVPWKGKTIRAAVTPLFNRKSGKRKSNF